MCFIFVFYLLSIILNNYIFCNHSDAEDIVRSSNSLSFLLQLNPNKTYDGRQIVDGDIVLPLDADSKKGVLSDARLWPNGQISYAFHDSVDQKTKQTIIDAIKEWEEHTCLSFTKKPVDFSFVLFRRDKRGCWSTVGKASHKLWQDLSIGESCDSLPTVIHEIGHAVGFYHEHSRSDRDHYVHINWDNVNVKKKGNFEKRLDNPRGVEYDYTSIMHYEVMAFSTKYYHKNTMVALNPHNQRLVGNTKGITFRDAKLANLMYNCSNDCPNKEEIQCLNGGYLSPYRGDGADCTCVCPPHTSGNLCETIIEPFAYYEPLLCGGNVTEELEIQTPGYPVRKLPLDPCSWWIQAPEQKRVRIEFIDFQFRPRFQSDAKEFDKICYFEKVEIRIANRYDGDMFCGEDIPSGTVVTSPGQEIIIVISTKSKSPFGRGLRAKVSFVDQSSEQNSTNTLTSFLPIIN